MTEKTLRRRAARDGFELVKTRGGRVFLLLRGDSVAAVATTAAALALLLGVRPAA